MPDPRVMKLAKVLVHYSVEVQKGQQVLIRPNPIANEPFYKDGHTIIQ